MGKRLKAYDVLLLALLTVSCSVSRQALPGDTGVYIQENLLVNGVKQSLVIRGQDYRNPVLLHVHGGPGYPLFPYIDNFRQLEKYFTLVYWEQRGTATSLNGKVKKTSMTTDTLLADLKVVSDYVRQRMQVDRLFLWGHSWGSNLGLLYAGQYPEDLFAYIGTGQSVDLFENERLCLQYALEQATADKNTKALKRLSKIDTLDYQLDDALEVRRWLYTYGGIVHQMNTEKPYVNLDIVKDVFKTPEYTFADKTRLLLRSKYSGKTLWDDMMVLDLFDRVKRVEVPVYFCLGRYDHLVSSALASAYFEELEAPQGKELIWFEESAHRPQTEEPEKFLQSMLHIRAAFEKELKWKEKSLYKIR